MRVKTQSKRFVVIIFLLVLLGEEQAVIRMLNHELDPWEEVDTMMMITMVLLVARMIEVEDVSEPSMELDTLILTPCR
jgi:hypothetical protein